MTDLGPLPRLHHREVLVREAEQAFLDGYIKLLKEKPDLTFSDLISGLLRPLLQEVQTENELAVQQLSTSWMAASGLSPGELASLLLNAAAREAKFIIRAERHGNQDQPGGLE
jgi:hypothetical protein